MKNMKLGNREIKLLLYLGGVVLALLVYQFYFSKVLDNNAAKKAENVQLSADVQKLRELESQQKDFEEETSDMQTDNRVVLTAFPAEVKEEDAILYAKELQDNVSMPISAVGMSDGILVYTFGQGAVAEDATAAEATTTDATATDTTEADAQAAADGETTTYADGTEGGIDSVGSAYSDLMLYKMPVSLSFTVEYGNMKRCLDYVKDSDKRTSIDTISLTFDSATGNLMGNMDLGMYYLTGTDKVYEAPKLPDVGTGTSNIFGTLQ